MPKRTYKDFEDRVRGELHKKRQTPAQSGGGLLERLKAMAKEKRGKTP